jgi:hypothetical protein
MGGYAMRRKTILVILIFFCAFFSSAQKVLYSPFIGTEPQTRFEVIGKAGDYYWVQKSKKQFRARKIKDAQAKSEDFNFEIYDERMSPVNTIPFTVSGDVIKEYFVPGDESLDQLLFLRNNQQITVLLNRFSPDGNVISSPDTLAYFPTKMKWSNFLLVRSQDKTKILLTGFETVVDSSTKLHSFLYDKNWNLLYHTVYRNVNISQPCVQYEGIEYPLEHFSNSAIKIANNGEWLMIVPAATNRNFLLFHFKGIDEGFIYKEIKLSSSVVAEEVILSLDNAKRDAFAGILSRTRYQPLKNVRIAHYLLTDHRFDFDTSFRFNTLAYTKTKNENIFEEYFMTVPGKGFMLLKEYGRSFSSPVTETSSKDDDEPGENNIASNVPDYLNKNEYTRYSNLVGSRKEFDRGDLSMYYFPGTPNDSCWSGIINKQQMTELSSSYLSYVFLPREDKLFFLYNELFKNSDQYSNTTVLDQKGNALDEGVVYWKIKNTLVFQKARQISENELAIPYEKNMRSGFAIIRL